jgi:hypothetical protein
MYVRGGIINENTKAPPTTHSVPLKVANAVITSKNANNTITIVKNLGLLMPPQTSFFDITYPL